MYTFLVEAFQELSEKDRERAARNEYNFDHPDAFDFELLYNALSRLREGRVCTVSCTVHFDMNSIAFAQVPVYDFTTHSRLKQTTTIYGADIVIFEGILAFYDERIRQLMDLKVASRVKKKPSTVV